MAKEDGSERRLGNMETKVGVLENSIGSIESAIKDIKHDQRRLFERQEKNNLEMVRKFEQVNTSAVEKMNEVLSNLPCREHELRLNNSEKNYDNCQEKTNRKIDALKKTVQEEVNNQEKASGFVKALDWVLKFLILVLMAYFAYAQATGSLMIR